MQFHHFPKEIVIFKNAQISIPTARVFGMNQKIPKSEAKFNLPSDEKVDFIRNLGNEQGKR